MKALLNVEWIKFEYLFNQYSIAFNPNSCSILVYKLITSKLTSLEFFCEVSLAFFEKEKIIFCITFNFGQKRLEENNVEITKTFSLMHMASCNKM